MFDDIIKTVKRYILTRTKKQTEEEDTIMTKQFVLITQNLLDDIATYMDDEIREQVHIELAPCTPEQFLRRYVELDPQFVAILYDVFDIEL